MVTQFDRPLTVPSAPLPSKVNKADAVSKSKKQKQIEARKMKRFNTVTTVRVTVHKPPQVGGKAMSTQSLLLEVTDGIYLNDLKREISSRLGGHAKLQLLWLSAEGDTVALNSQQVSDHIGLRNSSLQPLVAVVLPISRCGPPILDCRTSLISLSRNGVDSPGTSMYTRPTKE